MFSYYLPVWVLRWFFNVANALKRIGQCSHAYGRSPVCIRLCLTIELDVVNPDPQSSHINGCSPVCFLQEDAIVDDMHCNQLLGESIYLSCVSSSPLLTNAWLQSLHLNGLVLLWRIKCCLRLAFCVKPLPQIEHRYGRSPECVRRWSFSVDGVLKANRKTQMVFYWQSQAISLVFGY